MVIYLLTKVNYQENFPPTYNRFKDEYSKLLSFIYTKYIDWSYEKEYRIIILKEHTDSQQLKYKKEILSGIIFGLRTSESDKKLIKSIVKKTSLIKGLMLIFLIQKQFQGNTL
jgi:hypothetical protein